jgi:hypothetical protein
MRVSVPITWNGVSPRHGKVDPLWDLLGAILVLLADAGERIRWRSTPEPVGREVHLLVKGTWYEMVPPPWGMQHLLKRLVTLTARNWWDWLRLWRQHRRYVGQGDAFAWERTVALRIEGYQIPATCRVRCNQMGAEVELAMTVPSEQLSAAAAAALPDFMEDCCKNWSLDWPL